MNPKTNSESACSKSIVILKVCKGMTRVHVWLGINVDAFIRLPNLWILDKNLRCCCHHNEWLLYDCTCAFLWKRAHMSYALLIGGSSNVFVQAVKTIVGEYRYVQPSRRRCYDYNARLTNKKLSCWMMLAIRAKNRVLLRSAFYCCVFKMIGNIP